MNIFPAIDIIGGQAVRLKKGDYITHVNGEKLSSISDFSKKIETINAVIYHLLKKEVKALKDMYIILQTLLSESHKSKTENISNIKMLFSTVRNRDSVENLEKQINLWNFFLEIMKNYVIISGTDKHE